MSNLAKLFHIELPLESQVTANVDYGLNGTEFTGTNTGGGGVSGDVRFFPIQATLSPRVSGTTIKTFQNESFLQHVDLVDEAGEVVSTIGKVVDITIETRNKTNVYKQVATSRADGFAFTTPMLESADYNWSLRDRANGEVIAFGEYVVQYAAE